MTTTELRKKIKETELPEWFNSVEANINYPHINFNMIGEFIVIPGTTAIKEHTTKKELLKITDILGREKKGKKNELLFYIYDDGTVEKKINIE